MTDRKTTTESSPKQSTEADCYTDSDDIEQILDARHQDPFGILGLHKAPNGKGRVVRAFQPSAKSISVVSSDTTVEMKRVHSNGFFEGFFPDADEQFDYQLKIDGYHGAEWTTRDPYAFPSSLNDEDLYFFGEGTNRYLWKMLGAHLMDSSPVGRKDNPEQGTRFTVWAPNAKRVSTVGDFNNWDGRTNPMRNRGGVWEIFIPGVQVGDHYKFEVLGKDDSLTTKSDPFAFHSEHGIDTASMVCEFGRYQWSDAEWMKQRESQDQYQSPMSIYEVHLGSWKRKVEEDNRFLTYIEFAEELVDYVVDMGFTHIELMPVAEYPFDGSWGYQVCGYFAPTSRFGSPDQFRNFVDTCHQNGIGVIVDWVPAHFPKDDHGLARFDGTALYEHADPRQGEHMDWGTLIFNYGRNEVRNFLVSNALYWMKEFHIDGIRVDAVASMLYLDYSREDGEWIPNEHGGRENLGAIETIKQLNAALYEECPGIMTIAEESTAYPGVSKPIDMGGLGFGFKWNMGWMNDMLEYVSKDPIHRRHHHGEATFAMIYAYQENYILVLSHDEVVHGKKSMINKMPGDKWQQLANLRMFYSWMFGHPGKKLLFQGDEFGQTDEWKHDKSVDWHFLEYEEHAGIHRAVKDLNRLYLSEPALNQRDHDQEGFEWIDHDDAENSTFSFIRKAKWERIVVIVNATPVPRNGVRFGVSDPGYYKEIFNSDSELYGGSNLGNSGGVHSEYVSFHNREHSLVVDLPPLSTVYLKLQV